MHQQRGKQQLYGRPHRDSTNERDAMKIPAAYKLWMESASQIQDAVTRYKIVYLLCYNACSLPVHMRLVTALRAICVRFLF